MADAQKNGDHNPRKDRKFFFDLHKFDEPDSAEDAPPVFSEDDVESAKKLSFEQGRQQGLNESKSSREQQIAQLVQQISTQFATLFAAEQDRESRYEEEAVRLTLESLEKLFPAMNEKIGGYEAEQAIRRVLKSAAEQSDITIRIHPDFTADIEEILAPFRNKDVNPPNFHIIGDETLGPGDCRLLWADGGAVRQSGALAQAIMDQLMRLLPAQAQETVAADATSAQNNDITEQAPAESSGEPDEDGQQSSGDQTDE